MIAHHCLPQEVLVVLMKDCCSFLQLLFWASSGQGAAHLRVSRMVGKPGRKPMWHGKVCVAFGLQAGGGEPDSRGRVADDVQSSHRYRSWIRPLLAHCNVSRRSRGYATNPLITFLLCGYWRISEFITTESWPPLSRVECVSRLSRRQSSIHL